MATKVTFNERKQQYMCKVHLTSDFALSTSSAWTPIQFTSSNSTEDWDTDGMHDPTANQTRITVPTGGAGYYLLQGQVRISLNATGTRGIKLKVNGSDLGPGAATFESASGSYEFTRGRDVMLFLNDGDFVEMYAWQASGGSLNAACNLGELPFGTWLSLTRIA